MRTHGSRDSLHGLGCHDHGCLAYADDETLVTEGLRYLREGLELGHRAMYVGSAPLGVMREQLDGLGDVDGLLRRGALQLVSLADAYSVDHLDAGAQSAFYTAAIDGALRDGFSGLRTLAEATALLTNPGGADRLVRWEARADRMMAERPWSALCCYDTRAIAGNGLADVAAVHPLDCGAPGLTPFHLFSVTGDRMALSGSVDTFAAMDLDRLLTVASPERDFELDLGALEFIDHNGVLALAERAHATADGDGARMTVSGAPYIVTRVADLMGVSL